MLPNKKIALLGGGNPKPTLDLDFSKVTQIDSRITWIRSGTADVVDFEGLTKTAKANESRFTGARRVENLLTFSEDYTQLNGGATSNNTATATTVTFTNATAWRHKKVTVLPVVGHTYVARVVLSSSDKAKIGIKILNPAGTALTQLSVTLTSTPTLYSILLVFPNVVDLTALSLGLDNRVSGGGDGTTTGAITATKFQLQDITGQVITAPDEYVSSNVLSYPYHGACVDGVVYKNTTNGNVVNANVVTEGVGTPLTGITLLDEEARTNLLLNSATPATQNITTTAQSYTISMWGTGTCELSGTATGTLTGTGATTRVSLTVTATAGTLTLTFAGTNTKGQVEAGVGMSSYIATANTAVTRTADVPSFTGTGLSWYNAQQGTFAITASGTAFKAPSDFGALSLTYASATKYLLGYNNNAKSGSTYLYTAATVSNPTEYTGVAVPTTIYVNAAGIANISHFTYYPKALKPSKMSALL
jgi:hypothetical protein